MAGRARTVLWPAGRLIFRCHSHAFGSTQFDRRANVDNRFSPLHDSGGRVVGALYGGGDHRAAASETVFRSLAGPAGSGRPRAVALDRYLSWQWTTVAPQRDLLLVELTDSALPSVGTDRASLIEGGRLTYPTTRRWADALLRACPTTDGLLWHSRQDPSRLALVLIDTGSGRPGGLDEHALQPVGPALPFALPAGLDRLDAIGADYNITVIRQ